MDFTVWRKAAVCGVFRRWGCHRGEALEVRVLPEASGYHHRSGMQDGCRKVDYAPPATPTADSQPAPTSGEVVDVQFTDKSSSGP